MLAVAFKNLEAIPLGGSATEAARAKKVDDPAHPSFEIAAYATTEPQKRDLAHSTQNRPNLTPPARTPGKVSYQYRDVIGRVPSISGVSTYGNVISIHRARTAFLAPFNGMLKEARSIAELPEDWDGEGATAIGWTTFNLVKRWVKDTARILFDDFGIIELHPPTLEPSPDGAITIYWDLPHGTLHVSAHTEPNVRVTYYLETKSPRGKIIEAKKGVYFDTLRLRKDLANQVALAAGAANG